MNTSALISGATIRSAVTMPDRAGRASVAPVSVLRSTVMSSCPFTTRGTAGGLAPLLDHVATAQKQRGETEEGGDVRAEDGDGLRARDERPAEGTRPVVRGGLDRGAHRRC